MEYRFALSFVLLLSIPSLILCDDEETTLGSESRKSDSDNEVALIPDLSDLLPDLPSISRKAKKDVPDITTLEILDLYNYPNEKHIITTSDGYILEIHRIPNPGHPPILLSHGVLSSSADFLVQGPNNSIAFLLHDHKYDVWLFNYRGNRYSRQHVSRDPDGGPKFWQWSMHDIALYDLTATVDYIVKETGHQRLFYTGHSMGTMIFWILLSERPEYNDRFHCMQALAPVAYLGHMPSAILRNVATAFDSLEVIFEMNRMWELFAHDSLSSAAPFKALCVLSTLSNICFPVMDDVVGKGIAELDKTILKRVFGHFPAGTSLQVFAHVAQLVNTKRFAQFDFGTEENRKIYGVASPPSYNLDNVKVPISLHYGSKDGIVSVKDVDLLALRLKSVVEVNEISGYNHLDFLYSYQSVKGLYEPMLRTFDKFRRKAGL